MNTRTAEVHAPVTSRQNPVTRPELTRVPLVAEEIAPGDQPTSPPPGRYVELPAASEADEASLYLRETDGPPGAPTAVHLHGLAGSSANWTELAAMMSGELRSIAVDLPGFGFSAPPHEFGFTREANAARVIRLLAELGTGPVHLSGNSFGAAVAIEIAVQRPDLVSSLTLISPAMPDLRPDPRRLSDPRLALALLPVVGRPARRAMARLSPQQRVEQLLELCFAEPAEVPRHKVLEVAAEFAERSALPWAGPALARTTIELGRSWLRPPSRSLWRLLPEIHSRSLVVWGNEDKVVSVRKAPRTAMSLPHGKLLVLPRTGHVAQMERPGMVARAMLGMLRAQTW
ncbi:alpha/beta fold hydrolase [Saccharopolyspora halophila]|uniref:Alpha/beta fold hydrolase n=1 Tax=Saccharopolyspora halophila TaxID=405551 RepID=A0ABN3FLA4_9PSEU